jgi:hypothetical protein
MTDRFTNGWEEKRHKGWRVGTLWCANADVDGDVTLSPEFDELDYDAKLDLIRDCIGLLEREYEDLQARNIQEWAKRVVLANEPS